ncbi:MAG: glycosyltransferase family 2 protein [Chitinophagaceae bacterium]
MSKFSVVIVCKNEADVIERTLKSLSGITDDIIIYDNGSTDGTQQLVRQFKVQLHEGTWEGFGLTKSKANRLAKYDWILSIDADEAIDDDLKMALTTWQPESDKMVYDLWYKNFLGEKHLKYGEWGNDHHVRLFNKNSVQWDEAPVHEKLMLPLDVTIKELKGFVLHYTMKDVDDYSRKMRNYAMLNAEKYFRQGKKASWLKLRLSPTFTFLNYFIFKRGFMDGHLGYVSARMTAYYTFLKYARLKELNQAK